MEKTEKPIFSVSDFLAVVNQTLEFAYPTVEIEGEVASFKVNQDKYIFFDLKDEDGCIGCFMLVWQLRMPIEDGMKVVISATPKVTKWGKFSLTVKTIRPSGQGAIKKSFELLKAKLESEGIFSSERKRALPYSPQRVAVISSTQAAGYADFVKILNERWGGINIEVAHVQVQGAGAADQIIRAIDYFNQQQSLPEVLVIVRGGGSAEDLSVFNDELLVRAIASSRVPTLVGVGHETDTTLVDLAADVRASTPSNAAQILVPDKSEIIRHTKHQVSSLIPKINQIIDQQKQSTTACLNEILKQIDRMFDRQEIVIANIKAILSQLDPKAVLARGYAIVRGEVVSGSVIEVETKQVILKAEVQNVREKND